MVWVFFFFSFGTNKIQKIIIFYNSPLLSPVQELKKLLKGKLKLSPSKIKTPNKFGGKNFAFVCFRNETDKENALKVLDGYNWKGRTFKAKSAKAIVDPMLKRRLQNAERRTNDDTSSSTTSVPKKTVLEATVPLANVPYEEQLKQKEVDCIKQLHAYADAVKRANAHLKKSIAQVANEQNGLPCIWRGLKRSPCIEAYRNKNEFAVGKSASGEKIVGFRVGSYIDGSVEVGDIKDLPHVPQRTKQAVELFQFYVQNSKFNVFSPEFYTGQFRQLSVRYSGSTDELMLIIGLHTSEIVDQLKELNADIVDYFTNREGKTLNVTSIYIEEMNKREVGQQFNRMEHIHGSKHITDTILGLKFRISAASFFQINTKAAEVLYETAIEMGKVNANTTVLDICCGTGTIGLSFAKVKPILIVLLCSQTMNLLSHFSTAKKFWALSWSKKPSKMQNSMPRTIKSTIVNFMLEIVTITCRRLSTKQKTVICWLSLIHPVPDCVSEQSI